VNEGDIEAFMKQFMDAPFAHVRQVSKEEAKKYTT
jgi:hypothetical protein